MVARIASTTRARNAAACNACWIASAQRSGRLLSSGTQSQYIAASVKENSELALAWDDYRVTGQSQHTQSFCTVEEENHTERTFEEDHRSGRSRSTRRTSKQDTLLHCCTHGHCYLVWLVATTYYLASRLTINCLGHFHVISTTDWLAS